MSDPTLGRAPARLAAALAVAGLTGCGGNAGAPAAGGSTARDAVSCVAGAVERRPLVLPSGLHAYVEPSQLLAVGGDVVVVGLPTYTWELGGPTVRMASDSEHIAVVLDDEQPRLIEKPVDVEVRSTTVRSTVLDGESWAVLFAEPHPDTTRWTSSGRVFYAEYDGSSWTTVEEVPLPADHDINAGTSSALVAFGGGVAWAVLDQAALAADLYRRVEGTWRRTPIPDSNVESAQLGVGPSGLWLAMSGLDPAISEPRKSVRVYHYEDGWRLVSRDATAETYTHVMPPHVMVLSSGVAVTWAELRDQDFAVARVGLRTDSPGRLVELDGAAPVVRPFGLDNGDPAWVVWHHDAATETGQLRLIRLDGDRTRVAHSMPLPFTGLFAAMATGPETVLVSGAEFDRDPARPTVRSLTLRLNPSCQ